MNARGQFAVNEKEDAESVLRESEERFRSLTRLSSDFYWETDSEHRIVRNAREGEEDGALPWRTRVGQARWEVPSTRPDAAGWARHRATLDAHLPFKDFEIARLDDTGRERHISLTGEPVFDSAGGFLGYRGVGKDITAAKNAQEMLDLEHRITRALSEARDAQAGLREVMRAVCETKGWQCGRFFHLDQETHDFRFADTWHVPDPAIAAFIEYSKDRVFQPGQGIVGRAAFEPIWVADLSNDARVMMRAMSAEHGMRAGFMFPVRADGKTLGVLSFTSKVIRPPDERLLQSVGVIGAQVGQFLKRKRAEEDVRESEARFRGTFELAALGIAHVSLERTFIRVNRQLCEMLGYEEAELVGRPVKSFSHPDDVDVVDEPRAALLNGDMGSARMEKRYLRKDGSTLWSRVTIALVSEKAEGPAYEVAIFDDITERKAAEDALRRFRAALDGSADMVFLVDLRTLKLVDLNGTAASYLGYQRDELLGKPPDVYLADVSAAGLRESFDELLRAPGRADSLARRFRRKDGHVFEAEVLRRVIDSPDGPVLVVNARDLTERNLLEQRQGVYVRHQEQIARFGALALEKRDPQALIAEAVETSFEALRADAIVYVEPGQRAGEVIVRAAAGLAIPERDIGAGAGAALSLALQHGELALYDGAGPVLPFAWAKDFANAAYAPVHGESKPLGVLCLLARQAQTPGIDECQFLVTAASVVSAGLRRIESEARLAFLAQFDPLTGLPNRALLVDRLGQLLVQARRRGARLGVLFIDLDGFKVVNDTLGHAAGDELLKATGRRLQAAVRPGDTVARIAGDEFAVILNDLARSEDAALVAQKIIDALAAPLPVGGQEVFVSASIGIAVFPADGGDADALIGAADAAMYRAKQSGRNGFQFFTSEINQRTRARAQLAADLRRALEREEFALAYQPKFDLRTGKPCAAEALLRWRRPDGVMVPPVDFIPVLEESGLIVPVGEWVLARACRDLKAWEEAGVQPLPVAVNLSARQFRQQDLDARIQTLVREAGVSPALIELEITESQLMHDPDRAMRIVRTLHEAGIRIALDDFGTGYSSLSYLTRFAMSSLKIDRSFVANVLSDQAAAAIVRAIVDMAHTLGFTVVAEGVETEGQVAFLRGLSCDQAQGYFFARPMPATDLAAMLARAD
ncbi:MAG: EAL domain-containing protein [Clostridia bacterium]